MVGPSISTFVQVACHPWLPAKPFLDPLRTRICNDQIQALRAKEISREQLRTNATLLALAASLLNSLSLGLLIFVAMVGVRYFRAP
jgi:hypothetical protein